MSQTYEYTHAPYVYTNFSPPPLHLDKVGSLISFNMATAVGSQGCGPGQYPPASAFNNLVPEVETDRPLTWPLA